LAFAEGNFAMEKLRTKKLWFALLCFVVSLGFCGRSTAQNKPNIVVIMGDDIGWLNIGAYHQGLMAGRTPNLDKMVLTTNY
jgi:hypothetical protein